MLNHAFLIYAHVYPEQLKEIINFLSAPNHYCFINVDRKAKWSKEFIEKNRSDHTFFLEGKDCPLRIFPDCSNVTRAS